MGTLFAYGLYDHYRNKDPDVEVKSASIATRWAMKSFLFIMLLLAVLTMVGAGSSMRGET